MPGMRTVVLSSALFCEPPSLATCFLVSALVTICMMIRNQILCRKGSKHGSHILGSAQRLLARAAFRHVYICGLDYSAPPPPPPADTSLRVKTNWLSSISSSSSALARPWPLLRCHPHMMFAPIGWGQILSHFQSVNCSQKGGRWSKYPSILPTSYMNDPLLFFQSECRVRGLGGKGRPLTATYTLWHFFNNNLNKSATLKPKVLGHLAE